MFKIIWNKFLGTREKEKKIEREKITFKDLKNRLILDHEANKIEQNKILFERLEKFVLSKINTKNITESLQQKLEHEWNFDMKIIIDESCSASLLKYFVIYFHEKNKVYYKIEPNICSFGKIALFVFFDDNYIIQ